VQRFPFHSALKHVLHRRGLPIESGVRAPLRGLDIAERAELDRELDDAAGVLGAAFSREEAAA
jgi:dihydrodipicolinate synthase/N-acetylneuraminate lyase